jgi:cation:H+ antiporter
MDKISEFLSLLVVDETLSLTVLIVVFVAALGALIKGGDYLLEGAERIGKYFKLPSFVIGALIVGVGTSLPELASSLFAVKAGETSIVIGNVIGSNIANILLVAGLASVFGGVIYTTKSLAKLEIPLLVISTSFFLFMAQDGIITFSESIIMFIAFIIYVVYLLNADRYQTEDDKKEKKLLEKESKNNGEEKVEKIGIKEILLLLGGGALLALGASFLIDSVVAVSKQQNISPSIVSALAVAIGTSLPEILVSVKAVFRGKSDLAFGNIFGSNVFNMLMITGVVGIFSDLEVGKVMVDIGLPFLAITTLIFYVSATARRIYI